jgi:transcriptional regulator with PAS, ATPase and Fis domain
VQKIGKGVVRPPFPRFVFAANKDPDECIKEGTLRGDFWDRINQGIIHVPQLRERPDDIPYFLKKWSKEPDLRTWLALLEYTWPGNVRELERTMERIPSEQVRLEDLPAVLQGQFGAMDEGGIEQRLLKLLVGFLQSQGYAKGKKGAALNQRVAEIIGRSEAWVSEKLKVYNLP